MSEYKYIIFLAGGLLCIPMGILLASNFRRILDGTFIFLVFGTCMPTSLFGFHTDINFLSREWYRGSTRGIEVSYLDFLAIILLVGSIVTRQREGRRFFWPPTLGLLLAYFFWCFLNVAAFSDPKILGVYELTKVFRGILIFLAAAAYIRSPREVNILVWALAGTILYQACIGLRDRYIYGIHRVRGTLGHPNSLSMYCLQCVPIFIGVLFSKDVPKYLRVICILAYMAAAGCVILTISRTGFVALIILTLGAFVLFTGLKLTPRNLGLAMLGVVLMSGMVVKSWDTIMSRLGGLDLQQEYQGGDRGSYFKQGIPAIEDNPIAGVGLNNWSWWVSKRYGIEAGYNMQPYISLHNEYHPGWQVAPAHNLFLLTITELGIPGLLLFLAFIGQTLWITGIAVFRRRDRLLEAVRLGACLSLCGVLMQSWTEWEFRQTPMFFLGHIIFAAGAVLYYYIGKTRRA